jgi:hypothetical protein
MKEERMKKRQYWLALLAVGVAGASILGCLFPASALADTKTMYKTELSGDPTTTFDQYLVMDQEANVPNVTFSYAVKAGTEKTYQMDRKTVTVLSGVDADLVSITGTADKEIACHPGDITSDDVNTFVKDYDETCQKYAKKTATLDFSACHFTEPGVYRYIITESGVNQAVSNDSTPRIVDVYIENAEDSETDGNVTTEGLKFAGYVLHSSADELPEDMDESGTAAGSKEAGFTNTYDSANLTIRKEVKGNQASHDKYFAVTASISDAVPGTVYTVDISKAQSVTDENAATKEENEDQTNVTAITTDENGAAEQTFYLQHGQEITINGLSTDTSYQVSEENEDYIPTDESVDGYSDPVSGVISGKDVNVSFLDEKNGIIPTGVKSISVPVIAAGAGGAFLLTAIMKKRKIQK